MPANISGTPFNSFGISFIQKQSCWRKSDDILRCSMGQRTIKLSTNTLNNRILTSVARQSTKDINAWKRDEQTVYPSRVINQGIDKYCAENSRNISSEVRQRVFKFIEKDYSLKLNIIAAQSSINHLIIGNGRFGDKINMLCKGVSREVKNQTMDVIANQLADQFFQKHIIPDVDIKQLRDDIPRYIMAASVISA
ncbi:bfpT-regulated chaperone [Escherichia coli]|nr:bfpT-regulated chaperone [Escherichia coli]